MDLNYLSENFGLKDQTALITGAASGIGFAIAKALGLAGAKVAINDLKLENCAQAVNDLNNLGIEAMAIPFDVTDPEGINNAVNEVSNTLGDVNILINCAGNQNRGPLIDQTRDQRQSIFEVHVHGAFNCINAVLPNMIKNKNGHIVNMASIASFASMPGISAYATAKGALAALTRSVAVEYAEHGVYCNAVAPGFVKTPFTSALQESDSFQQFLESTVPMQRWGDPAEIAHTVVFLSSKASGFINGHVLAIDGGLLAKM